MAETAWSNLETEINGVKYASFSTDNRAWIGKIRKLAEKYPGEVIVKKEPQENDGCLYCWIPEKWLRIVRPNAGTMSEEQKELHRKHMAELNRQKHVLETRNEEPKLPFTDTDDEIPYEDIEAEIRF